MVCRFIKDKKVVRPQQKLKQRNPAFFTAGKNIQRLKDIVATEKKTQKKIEAERRKNEKEVARHAWDDTLLDNLLEIPKTIVPGNTPTMRCCVYKERAILGERVKIAMGGDKSNPNVIGH